MNALHALRIEVGRSWRPAPADPVRAFLAPLLGWVLPGGLRAFATLVIASLLDGWSTGRQQEQQHGGAHLMRMP